MFLVRDVDLFQNLLSLERKSSRPGVTWLAEVLRVFCELKKLESQDCIYVQWSAKINLKEVCHENEAVMRSLRKQDATIYFMVAGEKLTREQIYGTSTKNIYAIWPVGRYWKAANTKGTGWIPLESPSPFTTENEAHRAVESWISTMAAFKHLNPRRD